MIFCIVPSPCLVGILHVRLVYLNSIPTPHIVRTQAAKVRKHVQTPPQPTTPNHPPNPPTQPKPSQPSCVRPPRPLGTISHVRCLAVIGGAARLPPCHLLVSLLESHWPRETALAAKRQEMTRHAHAARLDDAIACANDMLKEVPHWGRALL